MTVSYDEAVERLLAFEHEDGRTTVHTCKNTQVGLIGADWDVEDVKEHIRKHGVENSTGFLFRMGYTLVVREEGRAALYLATKTHWV